MAKLISSLKAGALLMLMLTLSLWAMAQTSGTIKGTVKDDKGNPLAGASVMIQGSGKGTTTDDNGNYSIKVTPGEYTVVISFAGRQTTRSKVTVAANQTVSADSDLLSGGDLSGVIVVGSRSNVIRSSVQTAVPVDVFSARELMSTGQVEPTQMLNFSAPSFNSSRQTVADGTDHIDPATLRGLGPDQVLVLINGRRRHNTALLNVNGTIGRGSVGTDLNSIPPSAIDRIEVLRDGAASQYGSDAIAGVINVVLKKDVSRTNVNYHIGQQYKNDGCVQNIGLSHGFKLGKQGYLDIAGDLRLREPTNRAGVYTGTVYTNNVVLDEAVIKQRGFSRFNNMFIGNSKLRNGGFMLNGGMPLTGLGTNSFFSNTNFFFSAGLNDRKGEAAGFYRYPKQTTQVNADLYPDGFLPEIHSTIKDQSYNAGFDGTLGGWRWDLSSTGGSNSFRFDVKNSNNASQFALGKSAQTEFYAGTLKFGQNTTNFNMARDFGSKVGLQSFNVAAGLEYRVDRYEIQAGEEASYINYAPPPISNRVGGAQVFPGFQPANAVEETRNVIGAYFDLESDITDKFLATVAGRFERYSDFGSNFAGKLAVRYKIDEWLSVRGAVSNGFRAPSLHQRYFSAISTVFVNTPGGFVPLQQGTFRNNSDIATNGFGIPSLKAETSMNYSIGFTSKPRRNVSITVDAYQIDIKNRIVLTGNFAKSNPAVATILAAYPEINSAIFFTNAITTQTRGIDVVSTANLRMDKGMLDVTLAANFNKTTVVGNAAASSKLPADSLNTNTLFNIEERGRLEQGQPRSKIFLSLTYRLGKVQVMVRNTRFGKVGSIFNGTDRKRDEFFSPKIVTDASVSYKPTKILTITVGANNLRDVYPDPLRNPLNNSEGRFVYSRNATQFGFNGGYYFASIAASF
jgi:iron complex outermembrane recepter protein